MLSASATEISRARYLMGTTCEITAGSEAEIEAAFSEAQRIEALLSTWTDRSELARLNRVGSAVVVPELYTLLKTCVAWSERTDGAFNPLMRPLVDLWRTREEGELPLRDALRVAVGSVDRSNVRFAGSSMIELRSGARFEEGGFGKGYAIDRMLQAIASPSAVINFGGQIAVRGSVRVAIADPTRRERPVLELTLENESLSTSSGSEKTFTAQGRIFSHIIDPRSGEALPPRGSASAICGDALTADILSTALYVMGPDAGLQWADEHRVAAVFITSSNEIRLSTAFGERARRPAVIDNHFTLKDGNE